MGRRKMPAKGGSMSCCLHCMQQQLAAVPYHVYIQRLTMIELEHKVQSHQALICYFSSPDTSSSCSSTFAVKFTSTYSVKCSVR